MTSVRSSASRPGVEAERLPQGADPKRHLKLGADRSATSSGSCSSCSCAMPRGCPGCRPTSTLGALTAAEAAGLIAASDAARLRDAWVFASRARTAMTLWLNRTTDLLPTDRRDLEGVARLMEYPQGSASRLEEDYLRITRLSRQVFERLFYGPRLAARAARTRRFCRPRAIAFRIAWSRAIAWFRAAEDAIARRSVSPGLGTIEGA